MQVWDMSRAHFYGTAQREIHVNLPEDEEDWQILRSVKSMYGTQDASALWQDDTQVLDHPMYMKRNDESGTVLQRF